MELTRPHGTVALVDILGVSSLNIEDCERIIQVKRSIIDLLKNGEFTKIFQDWQKNTVHFYQFGDSILICCQSTKSEFDFYDITGLGVLLKSLVLEGLKQKLLIRGAIACGEWIEDVTAGNTTVIGPAIADAASWYEQADWAGVIATPRTGNIIRHAEHRYLQGGQEMYALDNYYVEYDVPLKTRKEKMWALAWPRDIRAQGNDAFHSADLEKKLREQLLKDIASIETIPKGTESKYSNTHDFIKYCWEDTPQRKKNSPAKADR